MSDFILGLLIGHASGFIGGILGFAIIGPYLFG